MSEGGDDQQRDDKEHEPTQKRLDEARRKGDVPRSADLVTATGYAGFLLVAVSVGPVTLGQLGTVLMAPLDRASSLAEDVFAGGGAPFGGHLLGAAAPILAPWVLVPALFALLALVAQRSLVVAPSKLAPKLSRISPLSNAKEKFGRNGLFEFFKSFVKLLLYTSVLGVYLIARTERILATPALSPGLVVIELGALVIGLLVIVLVIALALGLIDLVWQRSEFLRRNRMSRKELMDELKESEGDPQMKQQRRQKAVAIAMNQMMADVPRADVVIVNPTHYAVALVWDREKGRAPHCVAKGVDEIALKIRTIAQEAGVPIQSDPPTARALYGSVEIGEEIRHEHYRAVAAAIRFADRIRQKARRS